MTPAGCPKVYGEIRKFTLFLLLPILLVVILPILAHAQINSSPCTTDSQCADNQYCASDCGADVCPPVGTNSPGICAQVTCPLLPVQSDSCSTLVITNHACIMKNIPDGTACFTPAQGTCQSGVCAVVPTATPSPTPICFNAANGTSCQIPGLGCTCTGSLCPKIACTLISGTCQNQICVAMTQTPSPTPTPTLIPKSGACTSDSQCADSQYCASDCGADVCPPVGTNNPGICAQVMCPLLPVQSDSCRTQVIANHACTMQNIPDGTACFTPAQGTCKSGTCVVTNLCINGELGNLDCNTDGCVNSADFEIFRQAFGKDVNSITILPGYHSPKLNTSDTSSIVNTSDFEIFRSNFGICGMVGTH